MFNKKSIKNEQEEYNSNIIKSIEESMNDLSDSNLDDEQSKLLKIYQSNKATKKIKRNDFQDQVYFEQGSNEMQQ